MAKFLSGRQRNLSVGINSFTEDKTVLDVVGKVGIGTTNAQNHSLFVVGDTNVVGDVNITGVSTFIGGITGTATTATNLADAANITTGTINSARLTGTYNIDISGNAATADYADLAGIATYANTAGVATYASNAGVATDVVGGIASVTQLSVSGVSTLGVVTAGNIFSTGIVTALTFVGNLTGTALSISGISTLGTVQVSSGIITATSGVVTYYGDGSQLTGISASGGVSISTNTTNQNQFLTYSVSTGSTTGLGVTTTSLVFNPSTTRLGIGTTNPVSTLDVRGDISLVGVETYTTTVQSITPTADRYISFPDATGVVALVRGVNGAVQFNNAGYAGGGNLGYAPTTGTFGYISGGGVVTQQTNKSTGVALTASSGRITMHNANLSPGTAVTFTLTNDNISSNDLLILNHVSGGTAGSYSLNAQAASSSANINVTNVGLTTLGEAIIIGFAVIKSTTT